jgi:hypothetical protein
VRDGYSACSALGDCPAEPRAGHPSAAGFGLVAWGLGTEAPTGAEVLENLAALAGTEGQRRDFVRKLAAAAPAAAEALHEPPAAQSGVRCALIVAHSYEPTQDDTVMHRPGKKVYLFDIVLRKCQSSLV